MALIGGYLPDWALVPVWLLIALGVFVRDLLIKVPLLGDLILKLYEPALSADEARDPAAYREAMLIVEQKHDIGVPVSHSYVQVRPDVFLHVAAAGDSSKPMMLFLHGFPEFWYSWRHLMKEFSSDYYCVAIDQRGYNISSKPAKMTDYNMEALVNDVEFVVKKMSNGKTDFARGARLGRQCGVARGALLRLCRPTGDLQHAASDADGARTQIVAGATPQLALHRLLSTANAARSHADPVACRRTDPLGSAQRHEPRTVQRRRVPRRCDENRCRYGYAQLVPRCVWRACAQVAAQSHHVSRALSVWNGRCCV
eukprot:TRINITY_DN858_c0_g1_i3.p1 TRINITY_DN858_c0_g1~~TRINITY_DN858_c0_g1_i3.p1  ORF type:complete len:312 (-),score=77.76 TRINITY_DN858_c0_g1_i3:178-1113(-)